MQDIDDCKQKCTGISGDTYPGLLIRTLKILVPLEKYREAYQVLVICAPQTGPYLVVRKKLNKVRKLALMVNHLANSNHAQLDSLRQHLYLSAFISRVYQLDILLNS